MAASGHRPSRIRRALRRGQGVGPARVEGSRPAGHARWRNRPGQRLTGSTAGDQPLARRPGHPLSTGGAHYPGGPVGGIPASRLEARLFSTHRPARHRIRRPAAQGKVPRRRSQLGTAVRAARPPVAAPPAERLCEAARPDGRGRRRQGVGADISDRSRRTDTRRRAADRPPVPRLPERQPRRGRARCPGMDRRARHRAAATAGAHRRRPGPGRDLRSRTGRRVPPAEPPR
jgi:hypothetical protein